MAAPDPHPARLQRILLPLWRSFLSPCALAAVPMLLCIGPRRVSIAGTPDLRTTLQRDAVSAFQRGEYERVTELVESVPPGQNPSREVLRVGLLSYLRLGRPEAALRTYAHLVPPGQPEDPRLLREVALAFTTSRARAGPGGCEADGATAQESAAGLQGGGQNRRRGKPAARTADGGTRRSLRRGS